LGISQHSLVDAVDCNSPLAAPKAASPLLSSRALRACGSKSARVRVGVSTAPGGAGVAVWLSSKTMTPPSCTSTAPDGMPAAIAAAVVFAGAPGSAAIAPAARGAVDDTEAASALGVRMMALLTLLVSLPV
jgi:lysylphosphatidylglycerol synthetase-like protein (DUF2156 family)